MSDLATFFATVGPILRGAPPASPPADGLQFYAWLVKFDQQRILAELFPACRQWTDRLDVPWEPLVEAYVASHPPAGWSVPHVGERFADWLLERTAHDPSLPVGIESVADLAWTRFLARTAPDGVGLGLDTRVFVRRYRVDPVGIEGALRRAEPVEAHLQPVTLLVYRPASGTGARTLPAGLATLAALIERAGAPLPEALAGVPAEVRAAEAQRLAAAGVWDAAAG